MSERQRYTAQSENENKTLRTIRRTNLLAAAGMAVMAPFVVLNGEELKTALSGKAATEYVAQSPHATAEQIGANSAYHAAHAAAWEAIDLSGIGFGIYTIAMGRRTKRLIQQRQETQEPEKV